MSLIFWALDILTLFDSLFYVQAAQQPKKYNSEQKWSEVTQNINMFLFTLQTNRKTGKSMADLV
jgi:hypothetical protein